MTIYAVRYTYDERADVRDRVRPEHRDYLRVLEDEGTLLASGPFADGEPEALLVFRVEDTAALDTALAGDPFAREGIIAGVEVREWTVVRGPWAPPA
ncbi:YciI family protein [Cellulomonas edaphi]|uniref:YciI family protein n=1 Tax=Cellulomonas edaphi TaxID=3053468 RepID=A0ABT7S652_9CELL|nr:YciI family protein [Cellulomons edaphi]MDM7831080.1 YciI family protein [Cellulomons edaphi]